MRVASGVAGREPLRCASSARTGDESAEPKASAVARAVARALITYCRKSLQDRE